MEEQKKCENGTCGTCVSCKGHGCSPIHWSCCIVPILTTVFWIGGIVALVLAWVAGNGVIWGKVDAFWYLNSLAFGVLAMAGRGKKFGSCRKAACGAGACGGCKDGVCK